VRLGRYEDALAVVKEIDKLKPGPALAEFVQIVVGITKAAVFNRLGENDEALKMINSALEAEQSGKKFPAGFVEPGRSLLIKGLILSDLSRDEEALRAFEQAQLAGLAGNEALVAQGRALLALEDPDRAQSIFEAAITEAANRHDSVQQYDALVGK